MLKSIKQILTICVFVLVLFSAAGCNRSETMVCQSCNEVISEDSQFCSNCGTKVIIGSSPIEQSNIMPEDNVSEESTSIGENMSIEEIYADVEQYIEISQYEDALTLLNTLEDCNETTALRKECEYLWAINDLEKGYNKEAFYIFVMLGDYKDSEEYAQKAVVGAEADIYELGESYYNSGAYEVAKKCFDMVPEYENAQLLASYCGVMIEYQGVYKYSLLKDGWYIVISGNTLSDYDLKDEDEGEASVDTDTMFLQDVNGQLALVNELYKEDNPGFIGSPTYYYLTTDENGKKCIAVDYGFGNDLSIYNETSAYTEEQLSRRVAVANNMSDPYIGMTTDEVLQSTWGVPEDINKTTYSWGTTEQWVYSGYRYIYFENGIVVAIQE